MKTVPMVDVALKPSRQELVAALWPAGSPSSMKTWVILDGARDARIYGAVEGSFQRKCCLFAGDLAPKLRMVVPYLVQVDVGDRLTNLVLDKGWGNAWGAFLRSEASLETLRRHFRKFLRVTDYMGRKLLFRYYDPRVLRVYLPTCLPEELETVFGPVESFLMEADNGNGIEEYQFKSSKLTVLPQRAN